ncbi:MAG: alkaline shock response membrane anchor protein AmaP [Clostridiales bacterium]|nr:alkaline shock response membrane anchor protein AmaP [Clostridiales bacterium]
MNGLMRFLLFIYSVFLALLSIILLFAVIDDGIFADLLSPLSSMVTNPVTRYVYLGVLILVLISCILGIFGVISSGRAYRTKLRKTDIGSVDIGADALESIARNSAMSAQAGIKTVKARVTSARNGAISVSIHAILYSNVEIPSSMSKVQERIKKDIERYTGIIVEEVKVRVTRVEPAAARVEGR